MLTIFYFYRKNKTIRILSWAPFLDIAWNFFMFFVGLAINKPNDFIIMFATGNGIYALALVEIADFLWWRICSWFRNRWIFDCFLRKTKRISCKDTCYNYGVAREKIEQNL